MISLLAAAKISLCFGRRNGVVAETALSFQWLYVIFYCIDIPMIWDVLYLYHFMLNKSCLSLSLSLWHRDVQPEIVQSSYQIIPQDRHDSSDLSAHKIPHLFYYIKVRGLGRPLTGGYILLFQPCDSSTCHGGRIIVVFKHEWMIFVANYVSTDSRRFSDNVLT